MEVVLVPFHLARLGDRLVGMDAYFWPSLEERYRVVLLVQPAERLSGAPAGGCRLPARVEARDQVEEIQHLARERIPRPRVRRGRAWRSLAWLLVPVKLLEAAGLWDRVEVPEKAYALALARGLQGLEPLGETRYAAFTRGGDGVLLPVDEGMRRIYSELARRDRGYARAAREAACRG